MIEVAILFWGHSYTTSVVGNILTYIYRQDRHNILTSVMDMPSFLAADAFKSCIVESGGTWRTTYTQRE